MWALVESGSVSKIYNNPKPIIVGDIQYPSNIFMLWTSSQLEAIGIYKVVVNDTNFKNPKYYINTDQSFAFGSGKVTATYGTATALVLTDTLYTAQDETDGLGTEGEVKAKGLKTLHKESINAQAAGILSPTDWMVVRATEGGTAVPSNTTTQRAAVRTKANAMCTAIDNAADVDALAALYVYNDATPPVRPIGELPTVD
jgi:hypothetical protein